MREELRANAGFIWGGDEKKIVGMQQAKCANIFGVSSP